MLPFRYYYLASVIRDTQRSACYPATSASHSQVLESYEFVTRHQLPPSSPTRIAGILSAYDELIENSQRRIKILEAMARALYREWFVHFRFPGHENHPRVASPLGEIPQGWEVKEVGDVSQTVHWRHHQFQGPSTWEGGTVPWINSGKDNDFRMHERFRADQRRGLQKSAAKLMLKSGRFVRRQHRPTLVSRSPRNRCRSAEQSVVGIRRSQPGH